MHAVLYLLVFLCCECIVDVKKGDSQDANCSRVVVLFAIAIHCTLCLANDTRTFRCFQQLQAIVVRRIDEEGCVSGQLARVLFGWNL